MPGYSLHVGLNHCDPNAYPGWDSTLGGCINDANSMMQLASAAGFRTRRLIDGEATSTAVLQAIGTLGRTCRPGDIALISYSGHGGQLPDTNGDETDDHLDETWVLYDRQVCDDELNQMYTQFAAGVRVVVVSDSCHSGTVARSVVNLATRQAIATNPLGKDLWPAGVEVEATRPRAMPVSFARRDAERRRDVYELVQTLTRGAKNPDLAASLILLSGCQDNQLSYDGAVNGAFTTALLQVWDQGRFAGGYRAFLSAIVSRMPADQTPNFFTLGDTSSFETQKPFSVEGAGGTPGGGGSGGASTGTSRPTLREGSRGPDVAYLQQRLTVHGYSLAADGVFGPRTGQAVRAFQLSRGLTADGVVGPLTWQAMDRSPSDAGSGGSWSPDGQDAQGSWGANGSGGSGGTGTGSGGWDSGSESGSDTGGGWDSGSGADAGGGWDSSSGSGSDTGGGWDSGSDAGSGSGTGEDWGSDSGSGSGSNTGGGWDSGSDSGSDTGGGWDSGSDTGGGWDSGSGSGSDAGGGWGSGSGSDTGGGWDSGAGDGSDSRNGQRAARSGPLTLERPLLQRGDTGEQVLQAQRRLRLVGYRGPVDGRFTSRVEAAVVSFQRSQGIPATGRLDDPTWAALPSV